MNQDNAIEVLTKMRECEDIDFCDCDCFRCCWFSRSIDRTNALNIAIEALKKEKRRCHNCTQEQNCKLAQRLGIDGFCSEWEGEEDDSD